MVRYITQRQIARNIYYVEMAGLEDDDKPTENLATGSMFVEVDTGDVYAFDEESQTWNLMLHWSVVPDAD